MRCLPDHSKPKMDELSVDWRSRSYGNALRCEVFSTTLPSEDVAPARSRLVGFAAGLDPLLDAHWPTETPIRAEG